MRDTYEAGVVLKPFVQGQPISLMTKFVREGHSIMVKRLGSCVVWESMDPQDHEVARTTSLILGDARMQGQRRNNFRGALPREAEAGHRSARAVMDSIVRLQSQITVSGAVGPDIEGVSARSISLLEFRLGRS